MVTENRTKKIKALAQWLCEQDDIAIIPHILPDGDALGSALALMLALKAMGKRAVVCDQHTVPDYLFMLPAKETVVAPDSLPFKVRAVLTVDCADNARMGTAGNIIEENMPVAVIDHHETNDMTFSPSFVDGDAPASGILVYEVLCEMGCPITKDIATCLYIAISTDTGNFGFENTSPEAFSVAGELLRAGIDLPTLNLQLFRLRSQSRVRLLGRALNNIEYLAEGRMALLRVTLRDLAECGATDADTESIVNFGIDTAGVEIALLAKEKNNGVKFSLRSREKVNVAQAVSALGGGGHARAAGVMMSNMNMAEAIEKILSVILPLL